MCVARGHVVNREEFANCDIGLSFAMWAMQWDRLSQHVIFQIACKDGGALALVGQLRFPASSSTSTQCSAFCCQ